MESKTQQLLEEIKTYLLSRQFTEEPAEPVFKLQKTMAQPGATMVINGQQIQQPGQEIIHIVKVEFFGPGTVDEGTDREDRFEIIRFVVEDLASGSKSRQTFEHMEGFYPEELNRFKEMLERFKL